MLELNDGSFDEITLVEVGQRAIDERIELVIADIAEIDYRCVLDLGQNGPLSKTGDPFIMMNVYYHVRLQNATEKGAYTTNMSQGPILLCLPFTDRRSIPRKRHRRTQFASCFESFLPSAPKMDDVALIECFAKSA